MGRSRCCMHTGRSIAAAPSMGSWISYGLGRENEQLPGYVLLNNDWIPNGGFQNFASSFLPATHQATLVRAKGTPVDNIVAADPARRAACQARLSPRAGQRLCPAQGASEAIESSIRNYETAARMQTAVPELCDVSGETAETQKLYGVDRENDFDRFYCVAVPAGAATGGSGSAIHRDHLPEHTRQQFALGSARRTEASARGKCANHRPAGRRIDHRSQTPRTAGRNARRLGGRDGPHAAQFRQRRPRPSRQRLHDLDGRWRHPRRHDVWCHRRNGHECCRKSTRTSTTSTPRFCTSWGWIMNDLTFRFGGRDMRLTDVHGRVIKDILA